MKNFKNIKFIYFDLIGVLVEKNSIEKETMAGIIGVSKEVFIKEYIRYIKEHKDEKNLIKDIESEKLFFEELFKEVCKNVGRAYNKEFINVLIHLETHKDFKLTDNVKLVLSILQEKYKLGLLSNAYPSRRVAILDKQKLSDFFNVIILSSETEYMKPDLNIYQYAISQSGVAPSQILFIDDHIKMLEGARNVGIENLILFNKKTPQFQNIQKFKELLEILAI
ncbi:MAG: HAD family hydrolase [Patescibacteria group bacterium]